MRSRKELSVNSADLNRALATTDSGQLYMLIINELVKLIKLRKA